MSKLQSKTSRKGDKSKKKYIDDLSFNLELKDLLGCIPITISFGENESYKDMIEKLNKMMQITDEHGTLQFNKVYTDNNNKIPKSYKLKVGNDNIIDFAGNEFIISRNTRFIEYWNEFLDEAQIYQEEKKEEQVEGYLNYEGKLRSELKNNKTLCIGDAKIEFHRTLRIPDDNKTYPLPPSLGAFNIIKVEDYINNHGLPDSWKKRKGVIIPMWQKEAMFIRFCSAKQCAVKIGTGKINAVTGNQWESKYISSSRNRQNYVCLPKQLWLDGINCGNGYIRQFVAMPLGKGYTVEHQIKKMIKKDQESTDVMNEGDKISNDENTNNDDDDNKYEEIFEDVGGIQFEVFPKFDDNVHICTEQQYPELFKQSKYLRGLLNLTPNDCSISNGDRVYLFSYSLPESMYRDIRASDIESLQSYKGEIIPFCVNALDEIQCNEIYKAWVEFAFLTNNNNKDTKYVIIKKIIKELRVIYIVEHIKNNLDELLEKYKVLHLYQFKKELIAIKDGIKLSEQGVKFGDILYYKSPTFKINVKTLTGKTIEIENIMDLDTVLSVKHEIANIEGIPIEQQRLIYGGKQLEDDQSMMDYNIIEGATIHLVLRLCGGCFIVGTKILMEGGKLMDIEKIKKMDNVLTYNMMNRKLEQHSVEKTIKVYVNELCVLSMKGLDKPIICTTSHPIYVINKDRWCCVEPLDEMVDKLFIGDFVMNENGESVEIINIERKYYNNNKVAVYTLYINDIHNFFANGILVHNGSPFTIYIRMTTGQQIRIVVDDSYTIGRVKGNIVQNANIFPHQITLWYNGQEMENEKTLSEYGIINDNDIIDMILRRGNGIKLRISPPIAYGDTFEVELQSEDIIQSIKVIIQTMKGIHIKNQILKFCGIQLLDTRKLYDYGLINNTTLQLVVKTNENEMGLAAGGKMKQKIYSDDIENLNQYNIKKVTRVFINIANGNMWKSITNKILPKSPLNPQIYKNYGYPWFELYDDGLDDLDKSHNLSNIKSIKEIQFDPNKAWNCSICTFENEAKNHFCIMCYQGEKPDINKEKKKSSIKINNQNKKQIHHTDTIEDGDW